MSYFQFVLIEMEPEKKLSWQFLKNTAEALDSYRVRALIDAKDDIFAAQVYDEDQYYKILFEMVDKEQMKFGLLDNLKKKYDDGTKIVKQFAQEHSMSVNEAFSYLELLNREGFITVEDLYDKNDVNGQEDPLFKGLNIIINDGINPSKSIYEPVKVIFDAKICSGCGQCAGICPVNCIKIYNGFGTIDEDKCIRCGLCYYFCPRTYLPVRLLNMRQENTDELKEIPKIGYFTEAYAARTSIKEIQEKCQDGGITSTCLLYLFENHLIDHALGAKMSRTPWRPEPVLMNSKEDVLLTAGTKYVNNPTLQLLNGLNGSVERLAIVGVPCMMQALLKSKIYDLKIPSLQSVQYRIGIFCMESFSYESLTEICKILDVDINNVKKTDINKGKFFIYTLDGNELSVPIKEISHLARPDCELCFDLTSESADISIGSIGAPAGWNTVIIRTEKGKELFDALDRKGLIESKKLDEVKPGLPMVKKIANSKRNKCKKHVLEKQQDHQRFPAY